MVDRSARAVPYEVQGRRRMIEHAGGRSEKTK